MENASSTSGAPSMRDGHGGLALRITALTLCLGLLSIEAFVTAAGHSPRLLEMVSTRRGADLAISTIFALMVVLNTVVGVWLLGKKRALIASTSLASWLGLILLLQRAWGGAIVEVGLLTGLAVLAIWARYQSRRGPESLSVAKRWLEGAAKWAFLSWVLFTVISGLLLGPGRAWEIGRPELYRSIRITAQMNRVYRFIEDYAHRNSGRPPADLDALVAAHICRWSDLVPRPGRLGASGGASRTPFEYRRPESLRSHSRYGHRRLMPLFWTSRPFYDRAYAVCLVDGDVEVVDGAQLAAILKVKAKLAVP